MSQAANYCAHCGGAIGMREEGGRHREYCLSCGTIFYRNPLPVASAVLVNQKREVLLVKRRLPPHQGMWCLPIGFAELDETIQEAALRELKEETGVVGRVTRLLDVHSYIDDAYGDVLIVTFEVESVGGSERPGDDASDLAYWPLTQLPELAFAANQKALRTFIHVHEEEWGIQDSFQRLELDPSGVAPPRAAASPSATPTAVTSARGPERGNLLSAALVSTVEGGAEQIAGDWLAEIASNPSTIALGSIDSDWLRDRVQAGLAGLSRWLRGEAAPDEIRELYRRWGREMSEMGCPLHEVLSGLSLLKRVIWIRARVGGAWERPVDAYRMLEMFTLVGAFFDRATYQIARGYAETL